METTYRGYVWRASGRNVELRSEPEYHGTVLLDVYEWGKYAGLFEILDPLPNDTVVTIKVEIEAQLTPLQLWQKLKRQIECRESTEGYWSDLTKWAKRKGHRVVSDAIHALVRNTNRGRVDRDLFLGSLEEWFRQNGNEPIES